VNSIGNVGRARRVAAPTATELTHALNLLSAFGGGDKDMRAVLSDLKNAVEHNERLLSDIAAGLKRLSDLEARKRELDERESAIDAKISKIEKIMSETTAIYAEELEQSCSAPAPLLHL
jgi:hypothetical protein